MSNTTVKNPALDAFTYWGPIIEEAVGAGNYSMDKSQTLASDKDKYARMFLLGSPGVAWDLSGNEANTLVTFQVDCFARGLFALQDVYDVDAVSHQAMTDMGFRRIYGPELIDNVDSNLKRTVSRYRRIYSGQPFVEPKNDVNGDNP